MKKTILIFGSLCAVILLLFQFEQWSLFALGGSENLYVIITGTLFLILGMLISRHFYIKKETRKRQVQKSSLSDQELRVLNLMANGHSNKEIAEQLFIAETTVKSHVSKILLKLDARRRTEAIRIGRDLEII
ncbi:MAG: LuxR C-terminal-related transcriptional regulator [Flavobacteriaceae bacterium]|nr:LuxR C-terminal-related transcriptional regulator [Flavobacteriaceae bacterium]